MPANSSTHLGDSHLHGTLEPWNPFYPFDLNCFFSEPGCWIFSAVIFINILLFLPLCTVILGHGFQQWWKQRLSSTPTTLSHCDSFAYHMVVMQLVYVFGSILCICGFYTNHFTLIMVWSSLYSVDFYGETFFHVLTCVEHYLAVVHPITYLTLRKERWIRIRNVVIGCIWLLCLGLAIQVMTGNSYLAVDLCLSIISVVLISFCSLSVLRGLIHPGPGDQGRDRVRVHQSKQRAFYTIVAILGVLLLRCLFLFVCTTQAVMNGWMNMCVLTLTGIWISIPGSLMLPLLYLHRTGMLACLKKNAQ